MVFVGLSTIGIPEGVYTQSAIIMAFGFILLSVITIREGFHSPLGYNKPRRVKYTVIYCESRWELITVRKINIRRGTVSYKRRQVYVSRLATKTFPTTHRQLITVGEGINQKYRRL